MKEIEIPEGYEARIEDNKIILKKREMESENERMRKQLLAFAELHIYDFKKYKYSSDENVQKIISWWRNIIAYLEKQKEQNPAEWSEEFLRLMNITISQDGNQVCVLLGENLAEGIAGFGDTLADAVEEFKKEWRQFDRFRKATWKPSKKQMEALEDAFRKDGGNEYRKVINSLYCDLQKLL